MTFQILPLPAEPFEPLFGLTDDDLAQRGVHRVQVTSDFGFPCRISLEDAKTGQTVLLLNYEHLAIDSPYRSSHAIFVREGAVAAQVAPGQIPASISSRLISFRTFDEGGMMRDADVVDGSDLQPLLERAFENPGVAFVHLHNARRGCFAANVVRAD